jgi:hypothetical protein
MIHFGLINIIIMELYTNKINEFIDWVSGENVFTGEQVTEG